MKLIRCFLIGASVAGLASSAQALPITDTFTPAGSPITLTTDTPYDYQHSLVAHGFDPVLDTLTSATLSLNISGPGGQALTITFDAVEAFNSTLNTLLASQPLMVALSYLQSDGLLNVTLTKGGGVGSTFSFTSSTLLAEGTVGNRDPGDATPIPEPGTLALLGIGLIGGAARLRRRTA